MALQVTEVVTPKVQAILDKLQKIAKEKWLPYAREFDFLGGNQAKTKMAGPWMDLWTTLRDERMLCLSIAEKYGGVGIDTSSDLGIIMLNATKWGQGSSFSSFLSQSEAVYQCLKYATEDVRAEYSKRSVAGGIACYYLTEPSTGVDYGACKATAVKQGDHYILNGEKWWVGHGDTGPFGLNFALCLVKTDPTKRGEGTSFFIVNNTNPGIVLGREGDMVGFRVYPRWEVKLENCRVHQKYLVGREGQGLRILIDAMNRTYGISAYAATGIAECSLEYTTEYTKGRVVFGHPIAEYQGIHYVLADMAIECAAAHALAFKACQLWDQGSPEAVKFVVMAKMFAAQVAESVTSKCMKILSAQAVERGEGHPIERMWREWFCFNLQRTANLDKRGLAQFLLGRKLKAGFEY